ncbi:MAG: hypothetical protein D6806_16650 [Deltaproteobacteria bacterium]|nr:MAG: hypothetical protein D6806_16650 [Deltaproteobacteria bacterium]
MNRVSFPAALVLCFALACCYYTPQRRATKAHPSFLSEAEAEELVGKMLAPYGLKFISNMKLKREDAIFVADGYDRDLRVGFEYRSHEGMDFEQDGSDSGDGLSEREIAILRKRQQPFREYFLIVPEGPREQVEEAVEDFVKKLYEWEVLKKPKAAKKEELFPEDTGKSSDVLPWEATKDLRKKRLEMEKRERLRKVEGYEGGDESELEKELNSGLDEGGEQKDTGGSDDFWNDGSDASGEEPQPEQSKEQKVEDDDFDF